MTLVDKKIADLLEPEAPGVRRLAVAALRLAQSRQLPAEALATKLYQQLDQFLEDKENDH